MYQRLSFHSVVQITNRHIFKVMLTFLRPQQLPRTTEAGLVLEPDQKEGPNSSHTATENIYTAGTLEPWGCAALLPGPVLALEGGAGRGGGNQVLLGDCRSSEHSSKGHVSFTSISLMKGLKVLCANMCWWTQKCLCSYLCDSDGK